ncbi:MAG: hypothetical protein H7288_07610 [Kineosporiaceae bacterium]|nr:hypothetical protein [Aeromicrobium sp.]
MSARSTLFPRFEVGEVAREAMAGLRASLDEDVLRRLQQYEPALQAEQVAHIRNFVEDAIILTLPLTTHSVETLIRPVMHFVHWAVFVVGCELDAAAIFDRDLVETYVREALPVERTAGTRRNYRAWIFRVAEAVNPNKNPRSPMPLNQKTMEVPYSSDEMADLDRWAAGQPTPHGRESAAILIALGAGAGLTSVEIAQLTASAVSVLPEGLVQIQVTVNGVPKRRVVVSAEFENIVAAHVAMLAPEKFVFLPARERNTNDVVSAFVGRTYRPAGWLPVTVRRLRNTWLVTQMTNRVDVLTLMETAGLLSLESISRLAQFVPRPSEDDRAAQLRGVL